MANTIKIKTGSGSDPQASDLAVGELALRTDNGKLFSKDGGGSVIELGGGGGVSDGDKGDITVSNSGATFTIDNGVITASKIASDAVTTDKIADAQITDVKLANNSVALSKLPDGVITNAKINASAAIAGTKISPNFGSQNIITSGTVDGRDVSADGAKLDGIAAGANIGNTVIGTDSDINTSGATVIDQLNMTDGVITSHSTRTLTLANLGYTGATNANRITNNNQISNGAGYMSGSTSQLCKAFVNYNGNNSSIRNDFNVSSITNHGNGDQTVNFSSSISMSYCVSGMPIAHDTGGTRCTNAIRGSSSSGPTRMNSTGVRINRGFGSHNAFQSGHTMCVAIHRP